jgi:hypothetical protein
MLQMATDLGRSAPWQEAPYDAAVAGKAAANITAIASTKAWTGSRGVGIPEIDRQLRCPQSGRSRMISAEDCRPEHGSGAVQHGEHRSCQPEDRDGYRRGLRACLGLSPARGIGVLDEWHLVAGRDLPRPFLNKKARLNIDDHDFPDRDMLYD